MTIEFRWYHSADVRPLIGRLLNWAASAGGYVEYTDLAAHFDDLYQVVVDQNALAYIRRTLRQINRHGTIIDWYRVA